MEFTLNDVDYRVAKLNVFEQLKVARKLLPVLAEVLTQLRGHPGGATNMAIETALPAIANAIAQLSDDDINAITFPCLSVVSRQHLKAWIPVFTDDALAFDDIDLLTMLQLVARVVVDSLGNFLHVLPTSGMPAPVTAD